MKFTVKIILILFCGSLFATEPNVPASESCEAFVAAVPGAALTDAEKRSLLLKRIVNANLLIPQNNAAIKILILGTVLAEPFLLEAVEVAPSAREVVDLHARMERAHLAFGMTKPVTVDRVRQIIEAYVQLIYASLAEVGSSFEPRNSLWPKLETALDEGDHGKLLRFLPELKQFLARHGARHSGLSVFGRLLSSVLNSDDFRTFANESRDTIRESLSTKGIYGLERRLTAERSAKRFLRKSFSREANLQLEPLQAQFAQAVFSGLVAD